jgi:hypothetical protein
VDSLAGKVLNTTLLLDPNLRKKFLVGIPRRHAPLRIYHPDLNGCPLNPYRMRDLKMDYYVGRTRRLERILAHKLKFLTSDMLQCIL